MKRIALAFALTVCAILSAQNRANVRASRDAFFDSVLGRSPGGGAVWEVAGPSPDEIFPSPEVVVSRLAGFVTRHSASGRSAYTEIQLNVEQVLLDKDGGLSPGKAATLILGGPESQSGIQPGHRYVLFLSRHKDGDFYIYGEAWELVEGKAVPVSQDDVARTRKGASRLAGLSEGQFIDTIRSAVTTR